MAAGGLDAMAANCMEAFPPVYSRYLFTVDGQILISAVCRDHAVRRIFACFLPFVEDMANPSATTQGKRPLEHRR